MRGASTAGITSIERKRNGSCEKEKEREAKFRREQQKIDARSKRRQEAAARNRAQQLKQRGSKLRSNRRNADQGKAHVVRAPSADVLSRVVRTGVLSASNLSPRVRSHLRPIMGTATESMKMDENFADAPRRVRDLDLWDRKQKARIAAKKEQDDAAVVAKLASDPNNGRNDKVPSTPDRSGKPTRQWAKEKWRQENDKMGDILERHRRKREQEARRRKEVAKAAIVARAGGAGVENGRRSEDRAGKPETQHSVNERRAKVERERQARRDVNALPDAPTQPDAPVRKKGIRSGNGGGTSSDANGPKVINPFPSEMDNLRSASTRNNEAAANAASDADKRRLRPRVPPREHLQE